MSKTNGSGRLPIDSVPFGSDRAVPVVDIADYVIEPAVLALVPRLLCDRHTSLPIARVGDRLIVAMADPGNLTTYEELGSHTGLRIEAVTAPEASILAAILRYHGDDSRRR
jgi:type IV pilus assembly protein PilB